MLVPSLLEEQREPKPVGVGVRVGEEVLLPSFTHSISDCIHASSLSLADLSGLELPVQL
jgi:hypothetical protein